MLTSQTTLRARAFFVTAGLAGLLGSLGGCIIDAKIGDDPEGDAGTTGDSGEGESSTTFFPGYTSGAESGTSSTSTGSPGSASATSTTSTTGGEPSASATATGPGPGVDQDAALELCGIEVVPPEPESPVYYEGVECSEGCSIDIVTSVWIGIWDYSECLCAAMACGEPTGGTTSDGGEVPTDTETETDTGGEPDGCGPFPDGNADFTCSCEMCSIDVNDVDAAWLEGEADLEVICECMCGGAGCGSPV